MILVDLHLKDDDVRNIYATRIKNMF